MRVSRYKSNLLDSNMYILEDASHGIVVDPCGDFLDAGIASIDYILLTHEHYDHISGVNRWKKRTGAPVICSSACARNIANPKNNLARYFEFVCNAQQWVAEQDLSVVDADYACEADLVFDGELYFDWFGNDVRLLEMPGHAQGAIGIFVNDDHFFAGDNMIPDFKVELRLPGGSKESWKEITVPLLKELPAGINVHPGHFGCFVYTGDIREFI